MTDKPCRVIRYSDQMQCTCGLAWDVNDPEPPVCPNKATMSAPEPHEKALTDIWNVLETPDKNQNPRGIRQHHDALLTENARLQRIIAQIKTVCIPYGGRLRDRIMELAIEADTRPGGR